MSTLDQHQLAYLRAMGIKAWLPRESSETQAVTASPEEAVKSPAEAVKAKVQGAGVSNRTADLDALLGRRQPADEPADTIQPVDIDRGVAGLDWPALQARVRQCTACVLHETRTQTVFGVGNQQADWLIIGEAPGADEDRQGEPFVGRAGQLLNNMLLAIGLRREQVYIANILKCRPPNNRDPRPEEVSHCESFLRRQVQLLQPRIILAVGRIAAQNLLKTDLSLARLRGKVHAYDAGEGGAVNEPRAGLNQIPVVITYHPAYLLRSPKEKRKAWQDLQMARQISLESVPV